MSQFFTTSPVKFGGRLGKNIEWEDRDQPATEPLILYIWLAAAARCERSGARWKSSSANL